MAEPGWLDRQLGAVAAEVREWPGWMRRAAGLDEGPANPCGQGEDDDMRSDPEQRPTPARQREPIPTPGEVLLARAALTPREEAALDELGTALREAAEKRAAREAWERAHTCPHCGRCDPPPPWLAG